jgi:hypothetical protein
MCVDVDAGFITHGDFWDKLQRLPKIAEALDLTSFVQEEDGSTQLFRILNPGSVKALDNKKCIFAFVSLFTPPSISHVNQSYT